MNCLANTWSMILVHQGQSSESVSALRPGNLQPAGNRKARRRFLQNHLHRGCLPAPGWPVETGFLPKPKEHVMSMENRKASQIPTHSSICPQSLDNPQKPTGSTWWQKKPLVNRNPSATLQRCSQAVNRAMNITMQELKTGISSEKKMG